MVRRSQVRIHFRCTKKNNNDGMPMAGVPGAGPIGLHVPGAGAGAGALLHSRLISISDLFICVQLWSVNIPLICFAVD